jgi:protein ImuB
LPTVLPRLPVEGLRLEEEIVAVLRHLGIDTIGGLEKLPRDALPARFGEKLVRRVDQLYGRAIEPLTPLPFCKPIRAAIDFDGVVGAPEALWEAMRQLLGQVVGELVKRGCGAKTVEAAFVLPEGEPIRKTIQLSSASRDAGTLFNLLRCAMEMLIPATSRQQRKRRAFDPVRRRVVRYVPEGFVGLRLEVPGFERLSEEQVSLLEQEALDADRELSRLIERLRVKLGERVVTRAACVEGHLPEMGWRLDLSPSPGTPGEGRGGGCSSIVNRKSQTKTAPTLTLPRSTGRGDQKSHRPLHLLQTPVEVRVMVSPSHDRDGRPVAFVYEGKTHAVPFAVGPERLCGPWWLGRHKTRDYFDAADETGERFWLFRVLETGKWYLHGMFQ